MTAISALQAALAAENAAIYGYGVAGAYLAGSKQAAAIQDWTDHNEARDTLSAMITRLRAAPAAAAAFYALPFPVHNSHAAMALAAYLEDGVTRAYLGVVAVDDPRAAGLRRAGHAGTGAARCLLARPHAALPRPSQLGQSP